MTLSIHPVYNNRVVFQPKKHQDAVVFSGNKSVPSETSLINKTSTGKDLQKGVIKDNFGNVHTRNTTEMFRDDLNWKNLQYYLYTRFKNESKVNSYIYAASSGSEAYSYCMALRNKFRSDADKFFPVIALDINDKQIDEAKRIQQDGGKDCIKHTLEYELNFEAGEYEKYVAKNMHTRSLTPLITQSVKFETANIISDIERIDSKHTSVVMCRNMWPYVNPDEYTEYAEKLYKKLAKGSVVIIGEFDLAGEDGYKGSHLFPRALKQAGFERAKEYAGENRDYIFEKN